MMTIRHGDVLRRQRDMKVTRTNLFLTWNSM